MNTDGQDVVERMEPKVGGGERNRLGQSVERPSIHFSELPESTPDSPIATEWNFYLTQVGRLLTEGHAGKWVLIKGEAIIGIWDAEEDADQVRLQKFSMQHVLLKQICVREPVLRGGGHFRSWRS
jgi:hypothetical protein